MFNYFNKLIDDLFKKGIERGDILWFIDRNVRNNSKSCISFTASFLLITFCTIEVGCQLYMLTQKPSIGQVLMFGPMFLISIHALSTAIPLIFQRYRYREIYNIYMDLWALKTADERGLKEIRVVFRWGLYTVIFFFFLGLICGLGFYPLDGLDYNRTVFPAIAALKLIEKGPKTVIYSVIFINFGLVFVKAYFLGSYGLHLMHMCTLYTIQSVLLKRRLKNIKYDDGRAISPLLLVDNEQYQQWVANELRECIKQDIKLKKFSASLIGYFKWVIFIHCGNVIMLLSIFYYINLFMSGGFNPMGSRVFLFAANSMAFVYTTYSEVFREQVVKIGDALYETPWYTFNTSNRKLVLTILSNLTKPKFISAGVFDVNYNLLLFIMHKCFNGLTILAKLSPEEN